MKLFKKIFLPLLAALTLMAVCVAFAACGETDPDANLGEHQYVVYVYLDDGTTPVEGVDFQLCYNTDDTHSSCSSDNFVTDSNGRVLFDLTNTTYQGNPVIHITYTYDYDNFDTTTKEYAKVYSCLPDGYGLPSTGTTISLNGNASYDHAWALSSQVMTLTLTKSN